MKKQMILILTALLVLSAVGTAVAQETIDGMSASAGAQGMGPSPYDLVAPFGRIDLEDIKPLQLALLQPTGEHVPYAWDLNHDGMIDMLDISMVAGRFGCTVVDACYWR